MKSVLLALLLFPSLCYCQKEPTDKEVKFAYEAIPKVDGQYEYSEVVALDSCFKKDLLYRNAKLFFTNEFKSAKDVIQYDDRPEGKLIGKGNFHLEDGQGAFLVYFSEKRDINFTLEILCKDGKYKYRIYNINTDFTGRASGGNTPDNVYSGHLDIDESYAKTIKGGTKKMDRRLFLQTISEIKSTAQDIKIAMGKAASKDDF